MLQEGFQTIVDEVTKQCLDHFSSRLAAAYITGSVYTGEAVKGESDLDYWAVVYDEISSRDIEWKHKTETEIDDAQDISHGVHINLMSSEDLKENKFARFILKYNSQLDYGCDIVSALEPSGYDVYFPDKLVAKARLAFARSCFEDALQGRCPLCMDRIPVNSFYAARKFARYFILVEGAYLLMSRGEFVSFRQEQILSQLNQIGTGFSEVLDISRRVLKDPLKTGIRHTDFVLCIRPFMEWVFGEIERA